MQRKLAPHMEKIVPLPSIYYPDFIAANQSERANNLIEAGTKQQDLDRIRADIRKFKKDNGELVASRPELCCGPALRAAHTRAHAHAVRVPFCWSVSFP